MQNSAIAPSPQSGNGIAKRKNITTFEEHLESKYGLIGSQPRMEFMAKAHAFQLCIQLINLRTAAGLTQQQLADRIGAKRAYITRIENGHIDIQLSTYLRFLEGLGHRLEISPI